MARLAPLCMALLVRARSEGPRRSDARGPVTQAGAHLVALLHRLQLPLQHAHPGGQVGAEAGVGVLGLVALGHHQRAHRDQLHLRHARATAAGQVCSWRLAHPERSLRWHAHDLGARACAYTRTHLVRQDAHAAEVGELARLLVHRVAEDGEAGHVDRQQQAHDHVGLPAEALHGLLRRGAGQQALELLQPLGAPAAGAGGGGVRALTAAVELAWRAPHPAQQNRLGRTSPERQAQRVQLASPGPQLAQTSAPRPAPAPT